MNLLSDWGRQRIQASASSPGLFSRSAFRRSCRRHQGWADL